MIPILWLSVVVSTRGCIYRGSLLAIVAGGVGLSMVLAEEGVGRDMGMPTAHYPILGVEEGQELVGHLWRAVCHIWHSVCPAPLTLWLFAQVIWTLPPPKTEVC